MILMALVSMSAFVSVNATAPTVLPGGVYNLSATTATIYGSVNPHGLSTGWFFFAGPDGTRYQKCSGTLIGYAASDPTFVNPVLVSCDLTLLSPATTYTWLLEGDNVDGKSQTPIQTFTTPAAAATGGRPSVAAGGVTHLTPNSATLYGSVNPHGLLTSWQFFAGPGESRAPACSGTMSPSTTPEALNLVSCDLPGLVPMTSYSWVLRASNSAGGPVDTPIQTFTTPASASTMPPPTSVQSDWAVLSVELDPPAPQVGDSVVFKMSMTLLSSTGSFPQNVNIQCELDATSCGSATLPIVGPVGQVYNVHTDPWTATAGSHTLAWVISIVNDPYPGNNKMSATFTVSSSSTQPTTTSSILSSSSSIAQSSIESSTQEPSTQTTMIPPTQTTGGGIMDTLQQNSLLVIAALVLLVMLFGALAMKGRGKRTAPQQTRARIFCAKCGTENPASNEFCIKCGKKVRGG
jgi:hypothetical protein